MYTEEEQKKIDDLRHQREVERLESQKNLTQRTNLKKYLDVGDPVFVTIEGKTISGRITCRHSDVLFDVNTPYGVITKLNCYKSEVRARFVQDLSHVIIPDELKTMTTHMLLNMLQGHRSGYDYGSPQFSVEEIKAELRHRPHIPTKSEKKIFVKRIKKGNGNK